MPTSETELAQMRRTLEQRAARRARELEGRLGEARRDFQRIVRHIADSYRPVSIRQWDS